MNWQLLKNVNPPLSETLELYRTDTKSIEFAVRIDKDKILIASTYFDDEVGNDAYPMNYNRLKEYYGDKIFWTLFVKP